MGERHGTFFKGKGSNMRLSDAKTAKKIMLEKGFHTNKKYGQNFLIDEKVLNDIKDAADINNDDFVVEIGPGIGTLSSVILENAGFGLLIEIDKKLIPILNETLLGFNNYEILNCDVMKTDLEKEIKDRYKGKIIKFVANLPYYITTPILMKILESNIEYESITVMVQKEVAERIEAVPGSADYGALSLAVQFYTEPEIIEIVPRDRFLPAPKVDSAVVNLKRKKQDLPAGVNKEELFKIIRFSFIQRRKSLYNSLTNNNISDKESIKHALFKLGFDENVRGEKLGLNDFIELTKLLSENQEKE